MILRLAWRNIWRNKIRSLTIMTSVGIGLFAGLAVNALYTGMMNGRIHDLIHHETGHIQIHHPLFRSEYESSAVIRTPAEISHRLSSWPNVQAFSVRSVSPAMLATSSGSSGVLVNGISPKDENNASGLNEKIIEGKALTNEKPNGILLGWKLAHRMKAHTGSKVVLTFTDTLGCLVAASFRVTGIFKSVNSSFDDRQVYVHKKTLDEHVGTIGLSHEISVLLKNDYDSQLIRDSLSTLYRDLEVVTWKELSPETDLMNQTVDVYALIIMGIIMAALSFGIINTMLMALLERTREIGMMEALGMSRSRIFFLVIAETMLLTLTGIPLALLISFGVIGHYHRVGLDLSGMGQEMMSSFGFNTLIYPEFPSDKLPAILLIVFLTAWLSALLPAIRLMKLQPVEALRHHH